MSRYWVGITLTWVVTMFWAAFHGERIQTNLGSHNGTVAAYFIVNLCWSVYRNSSRNKVGKLPDFQRRFDNDDAFARRFNRSEFVKTVVSYGLHPVWLSPFWLSLGSHPRGFSLQWLRGC